jgi:hypothetical protein
MKLIKDEKSAWETYRVADFPQWGIEKIDRGAWYIFREWGKERIYLYQRDKAFGRGIGRARAIELLAQEIEDHKSKIIVSV